MIVYFYVAVQESSDYPLRWPIFTPGLVEYDPAKLWVTQSAVIEHGWLDVSITAFDEISILLDVPLHLKDL